MGEPLPPNVWDKTLDVAFGVARVVVIAVVAVWVIWAVFFPGLRLPR